MGSGRLDDAEEAMAYPRSARSNQYPRIGRRRFHEGPVTADLARLYYQRAY